MSSKYDAVKVKVHLQEHYYILSRFLLAKTLTFCEVPPTTAVRLSLELKKHFVDQQMLDINQEELEEQMFHRMRLRGFRDRHVKLFTTMTQFYSQRVPLVVFVAGTGCSGKSTIAHLLGSKLTNHNVINTEVVADISFAIASASEMEQTASSASSKNGHASGGDPVWFTSSLPNLIAVWSDKCKRVAQCIDRDINKALREGKVLVIEGTCLDLTLYKNYFETVGKTFGAIMMSFVLSVPSSVRSVLTEQWLNSRMHFLPDMSASQQVTHISALFDAVHAAHMASIAAAGLSKDPNSTEEVPLHVHHLELDFSTAEVSKTVAEMHTKVLDRIVLELDARRDKSAISAT